MAATYSYTPNGQRDYIVDANGNRARITYDDYDRRYRGVTVRGINDGGDQERVLVDEYQGYSRASHRWPRTADMLERMAAGWKRDAEREDLEARLRQLRG